ncbi:hypothetical protein ACFV8Z_40790 [Streptomyces sp. NPDC059837]|uniref:hypothetical protein n=1 Tax=unclassified Streptomyces TaxID=2593676 RepID=UPI003663623D
MTFSKSDHGIDALFEQLIDQRSFVGRAAVRRSHYDTGTSSDVIKEHLETVFGEHLHSHAFRQRADLWAVSRAR